MRHGAEMATKINKVAERVLVICLLLLFFLLAFLHPGTHGPADAGETGLRKSRQRGLELFFDFALWFRALEAGAEEGVN